MGIPEASTGAVAGTASVAGAGDRMARATSSSPWNAKIACETTSLRSR